MKFNYDKFKDINTEALVTDGDYSSNLSCFHVIQYAVESYMSDGGFSENQKELLLGLGILEKEEKKNVVSPHKFVE